MSAVWGISGPIGSGKTWLGERIHEAMRDRGAPCRVIRVDDLRYHALCRSSAPRHERLRRSLSKVLSAPLDPDGMLDYGTLYPAAFRNERSHGDFAALVGPVLAEDAADEIRGAGPFVLLEWAALLEDGYGALLSGPALLVECSDPAERARRDRLNRRGDLTPARIAARRALQPSHAEQAALAARLGVPHEAVDTCAPGLDGAIESLVDRACGGQPPRP